jgi:hypothetical protein
MQELTTPTSSLCAEIDSILKRYFGKNLYYPNEQNASRLLKLRVWSLRYKVDLIYILQKLLPYLEKVASKHYLRKGSSRGLGVSIPVLTGPAAEEYLKKCIAQDFPDAENILAWKESEKERCIDLMEKDEVMGKPRPILHYEKVSDFVDSYSRRIRQTRKSSDRLDKKMSKIPYRGNPWR